MYASLTYNYGNLARVIGEMLSLIARKGDHGQFHESSSTRVPREGFACNTNDCHQASEVNNQYENNEY